MNRPTRARYFSHFFSCILRSRRFMHPAAEPAAARYIKHDAGFSGAGDSGKYHDFSLGNIQRDILQVVLPKSPDHDSVFPDHTGHLAFIFIIPHRIVLFSTFLAKARRMRSHFRTACHGLAGLGSLQVLRSAHRSKKGTRRPCDVFHHMIIPHSKSLSFARSVSSSCRMRSSTASTTFFWWRVNFFPARNACAISGLRRSVM